MKAENSSAISQRPFSRKQRKELEGYVGLATTVFRLAVFALAVGLIALLARIGMAVLRAFIPSLSESLWWAVPVPLITILLLRVAGRWTGGPSFRNKVRQDLAEGVLSVQRVVATDAIEVEEGEDEGPSFFLLTEEGRTMLLWGQYLEKYRRGGFPWTEFEILEAPRSRVFFGFVRLGDKLEPSCRRPPFTWEEFKRFGDMNADYQFVENDFATLKRDFATVETAG